MKLKETIIGERDIILSDDVVNILGPKLELRNCNLTLNCAADALVLAGVVVQGGSIVSTHGLINFHFERISLNDVRIFGSYIGVDFGHWESPSFYPIKSLDLSRANLHQCRLINCDVSEVKLPSWPCFAVQHPQQAVSYIASVSWPGTMGTSMRVCADQDEGCVAVVLNAENLAKRAGVSVNEVRCLVEGVPGVNIS
ncbi:hypothetical protein [Undibacterium baiyunense]|uniref:Uncharacterized protein n=1 Tax=Undibacterium baiyunense TaxID=2828731 RepID=A0A941I3U8_9BURK|nr:hypothetical protein [Undibacterium baiyunense]MBR7747832.1 hypothetical protein [Undibacterium baiyunense]